MEDSKRIGDCNIAFEKQQAAPLWSPNSVSLASFEEAFVDHPRVMMPGPNSASGMQMAALERDLDDDDGDGPSSSAAAELRSAHERVAELERWRVEMGGLLRSGKADLARAKATIEEQRGEKADLEEKLKECKTLLERQEERCLESEGRSARLAATNEGLREELVDAGEKLELVEGTIEAKQRCNDKKEAQFRSLREDFEEAVRGYERTAADLRERIRELEATAEDLERDKAQADKRVKLQEEEKRQGEKELQIIIAERTRSINRNCQTTITRYKTIADEKEMRLNQAAADLKSQSEGLQAADKRYKLLENDMKDVGNENELLQNEIRQARSKILEATQSNIKLKRIICSLKMKGPDTQTNQGISQLLQLENHSRDRTEVDQVEDLRRNVAQLESKLGGLDKSLRSEKGRRLDVELELERKLCEARAATEDARLAKGEASGLKKRLTSSEGLLAEERRKLALSQQDLRKAELEISGLRSRCSVLSETAASYRRSSDRHGRDSSASRRRAEAAEADAAAARRARDEAAAEARELREGLEEAGEELQRAERGLADYKSQKEEEQRATMKELSDLRQGFEEDIRALEGKAEGYATAAEEATRAKRAVEQALARAEADLDLAGHVNRQLRCQRDGYWEDIKRLRSRESELASELVRSESKGWALEKATASLETRLGEAAAEREEIREKLAREEERLIKVVWSRNATTS